MSGNGLHRLARTPAWTLVVYAEPPPQDLDSERAVLASLMLSDEAVEAVRPILRPDDFYDDAHRLLYTWIQAQHEAGDPTTATAVIAALRRSDDFERIGGAVAIANIGEAVTTPAHAPYYAENVKECSVKREARLFGEHLIADAQNGVSSEDLVQFMTDGAERIAAGAPHAPKLQYQRISSAELAEETYATEYLIDGTLVANQPCIMAGPKKVLKTSLLIDLAVSLDRGGFFLGKLSVNRAATVAMMSGESGLATIQETAGRICSAAGYSLADLGVIWSPELPKIDSLEHLDALAEFIRADAVEVLIVDPAYLMMPGADAGNLFVQGDLLRALSGVCQENAVTLILAHHTRKGGKVDPFSPPELEDIAWAGFQEWGRQWLLVGRREKYEPGTGDRRLWLNAGGSAGHSALWAVDVTEGEYSPQTDRLWQVEVKRAADARQDAQDRTEQAKAEQAAAKVDTDKGAIRDAMKDTPEGETKTVIRDASGVHPRRFAPAFAAMLKDNEAVACDVVKPPRKKPFEGYKLA